MKSFAEFNEEWEWLHRLKVKPKMKKFVRYYLNWRRKNPNKARFGVTQAASHLGLSPRDTDTMVKTLNQMVLKGELPKHLAIAENYK